jgi:hypothetical protein
MQLQLFLSLFFVIGRWCGAADVKQGLIVGGLLDFLWKTDKMGRIFGLAQSRLD